MTHIEVHPTTVVVDELIAAWQTWAPDAADAVTVNLTITAEPGSRTRASLIGASMLDEDTTRASMRAFLDQAGIEADIALRADPRSINSRSP